jgi:hypothetical protein
MATVTKALARTAAATTSTTLYTVPAGTTAVVTNILLSNTAGTSSTGTIAFDGVTAYSNITIAASSTVSIDLKQTLAATKTITGLASTTAVNFHISGVEIN